MSSTSSTQACRDTSGKYKIEHRVRMEDAMTFTAN
ncbi:hypothetical protein E2C01_031508 [Portunus trituberculatus]|uniref:Uncharacterized protein n=1 Tax=Portunus trituberculatus TaxID=210409 RepID=A0A5B7ESY8_PORTR|nr:hypothetical protein [Portunus trituberculatus]